MVLQKRHIKRLILLALMACGGSFFTLFATTISDRQLNKSYRNEVFPQELTLLSIAVCNWANDYDSSYAELVLTSQAVIKAFADQEANWFKLPAEWQHLMVQQANSLLIILDAITSNRCFANNLWKEFKNNSRSLNTMLQFIHQEHRSFTTINLKNLCNDWLKSIAAYHDCLLKDAKQKSFLGYHTFYSHKIPLTIALSSAALGIGFYLKK